MTNLLISIVLTDTMATFNHILFSTLHARDDDMDLNNDSSESLDNSGFDIFFLSMFFLSII
jgi:hypothetical protein